MTYFTDTKFDKYRGSEAPKETPQNQYDPTSLTQKNPYLDVDLSKMEGIYNSELDTLESKERGGPTDDEPTGDDLDFLPKDLEAKFPDVYKKLMEMSDESKLELTNYYNDTKDSAKEGIKGVSSGMSWFAGLDVEPVKKILDSAKIEKGEFRSVVKSFAEEKATKTGEDFGFMARTALTGAMALKGLKRGGEVKKMSEGGTLTPGQEKAVNWSNIASSAVDVGINISETAALYDTKGDPYSTATKKETKREFQKSHAKTGATAGATTGAAIGSLFPVPVVGTAIGAAVGTAVGAIGGWISGTFTGNKQYKKDEAAVDVRETAELQTKIGLGNQISEKLTQVNSNRNKQDYLDEALTGPYNSHKRGGMVYGPRHEEGGVMAVKNGKPIAEVEGDEYIINNDIIKDKKESKQRFKVEGTPAQIASALNSYKGYGDNTNPGGNIYKIG